jgi:hypothetical protein
VPQHGASFGLAGQEHTGHVDVDDTPPLLQRHVLGGRGTRDARAVHGEAERAERALDVCDRVGKAGRFGHVRRHRDRSAAGLLDLGDDAIQIRAGQVQTAHVRSGLRHADRNAAADTAARPGDEGDTLVKSEVDDAHIRSFLTSAQVPEGFHAARRPGSGPACRFVGDGRCFQSANPRTSPNQSGRRDPRRPRPHRVRTDPRSDISRPRRRVIVP